MSGFQRRNNAFLDRKKSSGLERFLITHLGVFHAALLVERGVFRANGSVIETRRHGMRIRDQSILSLEHVGVSTVKDSRPPARKPRRVLTETGPTTAGFHSHHLHLAVRNEVVE